MNPGAELFLKRAATEGEQVIQAVLDKNSSLIGHYCGNEQG